MGRRSGCPKNLVSASKLIASRESILRRKPFTGAASWIPTSQQELQEKRNNLLLTLAFFHYSHSVSMNKYHKQRQDSGLANTNKKTCRIAIPLAVLSQSNTNRIPTNQSNWKEVFYEKTVEQFPCRVRIRRHGILG
tara:strand:- start:7 stop:414 length:408 start_codon:yes stop_codon:yes gene_type:complete